MKIIELAKQLGVTRQSIYDWIESGKVKARRDFSGRLYISKAEAERLMKAKEVKS